MPSHICLCEFQSELGTRQICQSGCWMAVGDRCVAFPLVENNEAMFSSTFSRRVAKRPECSFCRPRSGRIAAAAHSGRFADGKTALGPLRDSPWKSSRKHCLFSFYQGKRNISVSNNKKRIKHSDWHSCGEPPDKLCHQKSSVLSKEFWRSAMYFQEKCDCDDERPPSSRLRHVQCKHFYFSNVNNGADRS